MLYYNFLSIRCPFNEIIRAGFPTTVQLSGTDLVTTVFAPTTTLLPRVIFPTTTAPANILTLFPIIGLAPPGRALPIVTFCQI